MHRTCVCLWSGLLTIMLSITSHAQTASPFDAPAVRIARATSDKPLRAGAGADAALLVREYLRVAGHDDATVASAVLSSRNTVSRTGVTHLRFTQRLGGLDVYGTYVKAAIDASGGLTSVIENLVPAQPVLPAALAGGEGRALAIGLQHVHGGAAAAPGLVRRQGNTSVFARTPFFHREPTVTLVVVPTGANGLRVGYLVETWSEQGNQLHHTLVGGDGAVLGVEARTAYDSYNVFAKDPDTTDQAVVQGPGEGNADSPHGWLFSGTQKSTSIAGNNVHAYLDTDADNAVDPGGADVTNGEFLAPWDGSSQPSTVTNREVATQNLFYLNNLTHDVLYRHGFDEVAGNFQEDNFGKGGAGSDSVLAEVQDGSGTDNANFATPADGSNPRMQMFLWTGLGNAEVRVGATLYMAQVAAFSPPLTATGVTGRLVIADDGSGEGADACQRFSRNALAGAVAIVDRGGCDFTAKVSNAQRAGALAVVVANNSSGAIFTMGGSRSSRIPAVMVSQADGVELKAAAGQDGTVRAVDEPPLSRDSSLDSDVVYHEYGHGLTWRMIGSMSGTMSGAIGEGMSDVLAVLFNGDDVVGEYAASDPAGIRSAPYTNYPRTYGDFSGSGVHFDGEIYGAIGWRLRNNFQQVGLATLLDYIVDGMNYTPSAPAFEDMRDGILQAAQGSGHECLVWEAFAKFGVGVGAEAVIRGGNVRSVIESFTLPAACQ